MESVKNFNNLLIIVPTFQHNIRQEIIKEQNMI